MIQKMWYKISKISDVLFEYNRSMLIEVFFEVDNFLNGTKGN